MTDQIIRKSIHLRASQQQVWAFLTDPDKLSQWFHKPQAPLKAGEPYQVIKKDSEERLMWGNVLRADPFTRLTYEFSIHIMAETVSIVDWTLTPVDGGVMLSLEHTGLPAGAEGYGLVLALDEGWDKHLGTLRGLT
ncbi:SRPBCC domain-containing protein [Aestuariibius sp. HNIBRBA575]|uniref:SRPBCC family protein n=1 Tax=Aestuariibius sp. HNIBRBA575 TaxID=3233343 RepID=UPI0034A13917